MDTQLNWITETFEGQVQFGFPKSIELFSDQSNFQKVQIVESPTHGKILLNDGCFMLSERDEFIYHEMIAHTPAFLHPNPKRALIIGGGDGGTARELLKHASLNEVVMVEIDEMVVNACERFIPQTASCLKNDPRLKLHIADGVDYVAKEKEKFDIICVDSTDPVGFAQPLFGEEFYQNIKRILSKDGIVISQAESPFYAEKMQKKLASVLANVFPRVHFMNFTNMTYPGGLWSFSFASLGTHPTRDLDVSRVEKSNHDFKWYNANVHRAAFQLPEFQKKNLENSLTIL